MGKGLGKAEDYAAEESLAGKDGGNMKSFEMEKDDVPFWASCRVALSIVLMFNMAMLYLIRVNLSVAILCMVKEPSATSNGNVSMANTSSLYGYSSLNETADTSLNHGEFEWSKVLQGNILSAFYIGYIVTQIPGGWLATRFGGKHVMGTGLLIGVFCSMVTPTAARIHPYLLIVVRIMMGVGMGVFFPTTHNLWGRWAPPMERSKLIVFSQSGLMVGTVAAMSFSGYLCHSPIDNGWPMVFYVYGFVAFLCWVIFMYVAYNSPDEHPRITETERIFINRSIAAPKYDKNEPTPWLSFLRSKAVWAIIVGHTCNNWGNYTLVSCIPMYIRDVFKTNVRENGMLSALPFGMMFFFAIGGSQAADWMRCKGITSTIRTRKLFQAVGFLVPAVMVIALGYTDSTQLNLAIAFLSVGVGFTGLCRSGYAVNHVDIAPRYAGILMGISNTFASVPGAVSPTLAGALTPNGTQEEWRWVFFICAGVYVFGTIIFLLFAQGEEQPWGTQEEWRWVFFICAGVYVFGTIIFLLFAQGEEQPWVRSEARTTSVGAVPATDYTNKRGRYMEITVK